jgi:hypothetical protein
MNFANERNPGGSPSGGSRHQGELSKGIEWSARAGYAAKGLIYGLIGALAVGQGFFGSGDTSSAREALGRIAEAPLGRILLGIVTLGLAGYTLWRLVQALLDPEGDLHSDGDENRWGKRAFFLISAIAYGLLTYFGAQIVLGDGGGGSGGGGGNQATWLGKLMELPLGAWLVGAIGMGIIARGILQLVKAYTQSFREKISSFDLGPARSRWVIQASRLGLTARGVVFGIIGGSILYAALSRNPQEARGTEGALEFLVGNPWLLGAVGLGLIGYGLYQGVKARYRIIGV